MASPDLCSKRWVWEQYDHIILGNTVQRPGGDAAVVRVEDGPKGLALTTDVTPRYCEADPFEGGKQAVAEGWRNLTAVGAKPLAITDNLNFGNPERPEIMGQLVGCIRGIAEACKALDFPVVSGNVSLYNETNGRAILPTPTIGGVGLLDDFTKSATLAFKRAGEAILLIGETKGWLGQSMYLRDICGREEGAPPPVDLDRGTRERRFRARADPRRQARPPCTTFPTAGCWWRSPRWRWPPASARALSAAPADIPAACATGSARIRRAMSSPCRHEVDAVLGRAKAASVPVWRIGTTGGDTLTLAGERAILSRFCASVRRAGCRPIWPANC